jgi:hypothetical protein
VARLSHARHVSTAKSRRIIHGNISITSPSLSITRQLGLTQKK